MSSMHLLKVWNFTPTYKPALGSTDVQWWERSPLINVPRVQIPEPVLYVGWVCCWFRHSRREGFSSGIVVFLPSSKPILPSLKMSIYFIDFNCETVKQGQYSPGGGDCRCSQDPSIWTTRQRLVSETGDWLSILEQAGKERKGQTRITHIRFRSSTSPHFWKRKFLKTEIYRLRVEPSYRKTKTWRISDKISIGCSVVVVVLEKASF